MVPKAWQVLTLGNFCLRRVWWKCLTSLDKPFIQYHANLMPNCVVSWPPCLQSHPNPVNRCAHFQHHFNQGGASLTVTSKSSGRRHFFFNDVWRNRHRHFNIQNDVGRHCHRHKSAISHYFKVRWRQAVTSFNIQNDVRYHRHCHKSVINHHF